MKDRIVYQRDTQGWTVQVWASFLIALFACGIGVLFLPSQDLDRAFLAIAFFFCLFTSFAVAKMTRDNRDGQVDSGGWIITVWSAFAVAFVLTGWGLWRMAIVDWQKAYMVVSWLFLVSATFSVAKLVRDKHEADMADAAAYADAKPGTEVM